MGRSGRMRMQALTRQKLRIRKANRILFLVLLILLAILLGLGLFTSYAFVSHGATILV